VKRAIRVGTCGALADELRHGDLIVAGETLAEDGASRALGAGETVHPDPELTARLAAGTAEARIVSTAGSTLTRRFARSALPAQLRDLPAELVERVLNRLEPLGDRPQPPGEPVDVAAGGQIQVADGGLARLRSPLAGAEGELQSLIHPGVVDEELGELAQRALAARRDSIPDPFATTLFHIVHTHGTAPASTPLPFS
jgi:hypothetical protein